MARRLGVIGIASAASWRLGSAQLAASLAARLGSALVGSARRGVGGVS